MNGRFTPSRREQHMLWYLQMVMRFVIGGGGLVWEAVIDQFRNPLALVVFGALASSTDVLAFVRSLVASAREERLQIERALRTQERSDRDDGGGE